MKFFYIWLMSFALHTAGTVGLAAEIKVPQDYSTIQDAVNAAQAGDTVLVTDKRKNDTILIEKDISLIADPPGVVVTGKIKGALVIRGNARKVSVRGFEFQAVKSGIVVGTSDALELTLVDVTASQCERGLDLHGKGKSYLRLQRCSFINNKTFGFFSNRLPDMDIQACKFNDNGQSGLSIGSRQTYGTAPDAEITIGDSVFANNGHTGLEMTGGAIILSLNNVVCKENSRAGASFNHCVKVEMRCAGGGFEGNRLSGIALNAPNVSASYVIDGVKATNNGSAGASFLGNAGTCELYLSNSDFHLNNDGLTIRSKASKCEIENCSFVQNKEDGVALLENGSTAIQMQKCQISTNGGRGLYTGPPDDSDSSEKFGVSGQVLLRHCTLEKNIAQGLRVFRSKDMDFKLIDSSVSENSQQGFLLQNNDGVSSVTIQHCTLSKNRGSAFELSEFKEMISSKTKSIKAEKDKDAQRIISSTSKPLAAETTDAGRVQIRLHDSRIIANGGHGVLLGFAASQPRNFIMQNSTFDQNTASPIYIEEPILLESRTTMGTVYLGDATYCSLENAEPSKSADLVQCGFADLKGYTVEVDNQNFFKKTLATRITQLWALLQQSQCCAQLGNASQGFQDVSNSVARQVWQALMTSPAEMEIIPLDLRSQYESIVASASSRPSSYRAGVIENDISAKMQVYRMALTLNHLLQTWPDLAQDWNLEKFRSSVIQDFLSEYIFLMNRNISAADFQEVIEQARSNILPELRDEERSAALLWLSENSRDCLRQDSPTYSIHHDFMVDTFCALNDSTNETKSLEALLKGPMAQEDLFKSAQRLSQLYLEYWKLPEKAEELQRDLIHRLDDGKERYEAVLQLAKLLFESKKFDKCIFELERLLTVLPEDYDAASVRTMLGLAYMSIGDYGQARAEFADVINTSRGPYQEKCFYLLGYSFICEQKYAEAVKPFEDLLGQYPQGEYSAQAESFLEKITDSANKKP